MSKFMKRLREIDDAGLDPYQYRMVMHIWRVGKSWESLKTISSKCNMSIGKASQVRKWLVNNGHLKWVKTDNGRLALEYCCNGSHSEKYCCDCSSEKCECSPHEKMRPELPDIKRSPGEPKIEDIPNKYMHELSKDAQPFSENTIIQQEMVSTIAGVVKDTLALGINEEQFNFVASALIVAGITKGDVSQFGKYWKSNGYYKGKPALKSLLQEISNSIDKGAVKVKPLEGGGFNV